jgi:hypothetical protein
MKTAMVGDVQIQAGPDAPRYAACPACGDWVELRRGRGWYYRHLKGTGGDCQQRKKPIEDDPISLLPSGDPYTTMAVVAVTEAVLAAREGDLEAILSLAFSQLAHLALDLVGLSPEEVLEGIVGYDTRGAARVTITDDERQVLRGVKSSPGPVFDIRDDIRDVRSKRLRRSSWYVPLFDCGPAQARMIRLVLGQAERVYVLGERERWDQIVADGADRPPAATL